MSLSTWPWKKYVVHESLWDTLPRVQAAERKDGLGAVQGAMWALGIEALIISILIALYALVTRVR